MVSIDFISDSQQMKLYDNVEWYLQCKTVAEVYLIHWMQFIMFLVKY